MTDPHAIQTGPAPRPLADRLVAAVKGWEKGVLLAGIGLQLVVLLGMTAWRAYALERGEVYYVRVQPVDPRDLFRGDYVILSYAFSRLPTEMWGPQTQDGRTIYVELVPVGDGKHWRGRTGSYRFSPPPHGPYLRGKIVGRRIEYGIESFFVPEGKGHRYEQAARSGRLTAEICVAPDGQAVLRNLHNN